MITFKRNKNALQLYLKDIITSVCKEHIIIGGICFALGVVILGVIVLGFGYYDKNTIITGIMAFLLSFGMLSIIARTTRDFKRSLLRLFEDANAEGDVIGVLELEENTLVIKNINANTIHKIKKSEIKKIFCTNNVIVLKTTLNQFYWLPYSKAIEYYVR